jgi:hypothetical protein
MWKSRTPTAETRRDERKVGANTPKHFSGLVAVVDVIRVRERVGLVEIQETLRFVDR